MKDCASAASFKSKILSFSVQVKHDLAKLQLTSPVCTKEKEKIALSRRVEKHWRLIGQASHQILSANSPIYVGQLAG